jgi:ATP-dependent Clp protease ATP-binding subunit ClpC
MFEKYTEKARRIIFFARYEASQHGMTYIETPCLLLGIMREDKKLLSRLVPAGWPEISKLRAEIEAALPTREKTGTSVDLPLSQACKRVLTYAAEEVGRRNQAAIEPRHLLWGLLKEGGPETGCLKSHGIAMETVNADLERFAIEAEPEAVQQLQQRLARMRGHAELLQAVRDMPVDRLHAAFTLLEGLTSGKFEATGTSRNGPFHFSFDDKTE